MLPEYYDDGGYSGGTMERPGIRQLMADIQAGKVDVMVPRFGGHGFRPFVVRPVPGCCIRVRSGSADGYSSP